VSGCGVCGRIVRRVRLHHRAASRQVGQRGNQAKDAAADGGDWRCHARHIKAGMCAQRSGTGRLGLGLLPLALVVSLDVSGIRLPALSFD
jgi:hypothetical protein